MAPMAASMIAPVDSSLSWSFFGKGVSETEKRQEGGILSLLAPILFKSIFGKGVTRTGRGVTRTERGVMRAVREYNNMDHLNKNFSVLLHSLSNIKITKCFNYKPRFNGAFSKDNLPTIKDGAYVINLDDQKFVNQKFGSKICALIAGIKNYK